MKKFWKSGDPFIWLTGGGLAFCLLMTAGLVLLILWHGLGYFWPSDVVRLTLADGRVVLGQETASEDIPAPGATAGTVLRRRVKIKQGNRDLTGIDFLWVNEDAVSKREWPADAAVIERMEWGNLYGTPQALRDAGRVAAQGPAATWAALEGRMPGTADTLARIHDLECGAIAAIHREQEEARLALRRLELRGTTAGAEVDRLRADIAGTERRFEAQSRALGKLRALLTTTLVVGLADGGEKEVPLAMVARAYRPNALGTGSRLALYFSKVWEFVSGEPRESNTEGGIFPAIFGTVMMVMMMSVAATPLGVLAALFLREYARQGWLVSLVRIAVNNLAGVPSIVFGVFGVGFFIYFVGGTIDRWFFAESLPAPTFGTGGILWASLTLALLTVPVVIVATEEGLAALPPGLRDASLALGATKFETIRRVVIPSVMPSILTGMILAVARAAGEVAPLMITGVVKLAPALPLDGQAPFFHLDRKFMHLGFHIYDVGFQSPNVDAAQPMVFATTMLLLAIVVALNLTAIVLRRRLRAKYAASAV